MSNINFILQGKGGVGKSFIAFNYALFLKSREKAPLCIDTDPINSTLFGFSELKVKRIDLMDGDEINPRQFDALIEMASSSKQDVIIDNGASSFVPLSHYLITNEVAEVLTDLGHQVVIHTVITGGQSLADTLGGLSSLVNQFPGPVPFVVWLNPYHGEIELEGKSFTEMKIYKDHKARIFGMVRIDQVKAETFGKDVEEMLKKRLTYDQAQGSKDFALMARQRLTIFQRKMFAAIEAGVGTL